MKREGSGGSILVDFASVPISPKFNSEVLSKGVEVLHSIENYSNGAKLFVKQVLSVAMFSLLFVRTKSALQHTICFFFSLLLNLREWRPKTMKNELQLSEGSCHILPR